MREKGRENERREAKGGGREEGKRKRKVHVNW